MGTARRNVAARSSVRGASRSTVHPGTARNHPRKSNLVGESPRMLDLHSMIEAVSTRTCTVLIQGDSGVGKELVAREIHASSLRAGRPFVPVDCATLRDSLFESQLFGHVKGAFTGADEATIGFIRAADGGTLFLDEIGDLQLALQAKLLRCIQEGAVVPLGGVKAIPVDVRIITATHRDLKGMVQTGEFREDLYFRLAVVCMEVPPLRERREDVVRLARHFLDALSDFYGEGRKRLTPDAKRRLEAYPWPGNVRELANAMERAYVMSSGDGVDVEGLPRYLVQWGASRAGSGTGTLAAAEREVILAALRKADYVKNRAARELGIDVRRLNRMIERLQIAETGT
jgi:two-component system response regulator HydG